MSLKVDGNFPAYRNSYHFQACPKYRSGIFTTPIAARIQELLKEKCDELNFTLHSSAVDQDHFHFLVESTESPSTIAHRIFGYLSFALRKEFPELKDLNADHLWGGRQCKIIADESHFDSALRYVNRHKKTTT